jgi:hypothetical protein
MRRDLTLNTLTREFHSERPCLEFLIDKKGTTESKIQLSPTAERPGFEPGLLFQVNTLSKRAL